MSKKVKLRYIGNGEEYLYGVPAKDHEASESEAEERIASGLYALAEPKEKEKK